jgi:hypothetical protein
VQYFPADALLEPVLEPETAFFRLDLWVFPLWEDLCFVAATAEEGATVAAAMDVTRTKEQAMARAIDLRKA